MGEHKCLQCGKQLFGRSDKKYCNDYCRAEANNKARSTTNNIMRKVNNKLRRNRLILEEILSGAQSRKCHKDQLMKEGFLFDYFTNVLKTKNGDYYFCYEYGYKSTGGEWLLVVRSKEF